MKFVTTQRGAHSLIYVKDTSILSTEEEEMAAFLKISAHTAIFISHFAWVGEMAPSGNK